MFEKEIMILRDNIALLSGLSKEDWVKNELCNICAISDQMCKVADSIIKLTINAVD